MRICGQKSRIREPIWRHMPVFSNSRSSSATCSLCASKAWDSLMWLRMYSPISPSGRATQNGMRQPQAIICSSVVASSTTVTRAAAAAKPR